MLLPLFVMVIVVVLGRGMTHVVFLIEHQSWTQPPSRNQMGRRTHKVQVNLV